MPRTLQWWVKDSQEYEYFVQIPAKIQKLFPRPKLTNMCIFLFRFQANRESVSRPGCRRALGTIALNAQPIQVSTYSKPSTSHKSYSRTHRLNHQSSLEELSIQRDDCTKCRFDVWQPRHGNRKHTLAGNRKRSSDELSLCATEKSKKRLKRLWTPSYSPC